MYFIHPNHADKVLQKIAKKDNPIGQPKMNLEIPLPSGYRTIIQNVKSPNGVISEIQITYPEIFKAKIERGKALYNKERITDDPIEKAGLIKQMNGPYNSAYKKRLQKIGQSFQIGGR